MRTHKRLRASPPPIGADSVIFGVLMGVKAEVDQKVLKNQRMMDKHALSLGDHAVHYSILSQERRKTHSRSGEVYRPEYFAERNYTA